jgi:quinol monooxygenase YgiN
MLSRIVKMTFQPERLEEFMSVFNASKQLIRNRQGCRHLELLRDESQHHILYTFSLWDSAADLEAYRRSGLFADTWRKTRACFAAKAEAWSLERITVVSGQ